MRALQAVETFRDGGKVLELSPTQCSLAEDRQTTVSMTEALFAEPFPALQLPVAACQALRGSSDWVGIFLLLPHPSQLWIPAQLPPNMGQNTGLPVF